MKNIQNVAETPSKLAGAVALTGAAVAGFALVGAGTVASAQAAQPVLADNGAATEKPCDAQGVSAAAARQMPASVVGSFAWTQAEVTPTADLARNVYGATDVLCGSADVAGQLAGGAQASTALEIASIAVTGDVENELVAGVDQLCDEAPVKVTMGCSCAGNPSNGRASGNAAIEGFELSALIAAAQPAENANAITFVCADGYEVTMPLRYTLQHYGVVATALNGESCAEAVGCANQLFVGGSSARAFARNIVEVRITAEDEVPVVPGAASDANLPNASVLAGAEVA